MDAFTIPAVPVAQPRQRVAVIAGHARTYTPASHPVQAFKATTRLAFAKASGGSNPIDGPVTLHLVFVLPRPQAKRWKSRPMPRYAHVGRPDVDNLAKAVMDALTGLAWCDDTQVCRLDASKVVAAGDEQPHVEVRITEGEIYLDA